MEHKAKEKQADKYEKDVPNTTKIILSSIDRGIYPQK
jgi:hypothetical protein